MLEIRNSKVKFYKGHYLIVFYDKTDEILMYMFDNVRDILSFMGLAQTRDNVRKIDLYIIKALKRTDHVSRFLTGETLRLYIIDTN